MNLHFSEEDENFRREVLEFIEKELPADWKGTGLLSEAHGEEEWRFAREMLRKVGAKGAICLWISSWFGFVAPTTTETSMPGRSIFCRA